jgi:DNA-binding transcriptional regulator of glucitol operon
VRGLITSKRLAIAGVCLACLAIGVALAAWQWARFESASGTWQNLAYVLQWPLFGLFPLFVVWRLRRLGAQHTDQPPPSPPVVRPSAPASARTGRPEHNDDDPELAAYNRYLAELNAADRQENR